MTTTGKTLAEKAQERGGNSADAFWNEFGEQPAEATIGDWDSSAWGIAWHELKDEGATDDDYDVCLKAWRYGFFGKA